MTYKTPALARAEATYRHRKVLGDNIEMGAFRPTEWPVGACFVPILGKVFAPEKSAPKRYVRAFNEPYDKETGEIL